MPSGVTSPIYDGDNISLRDFVLKHAVPGLTMLGRILDGRELPERWEPDAYYAERGATAKRELAALRTMTPDEIETAATRDYEEAVASAAKRRTDLTALGSRYDTMIGECEAWEPATKHGQEVKAITLKHLREMRQHDVDDMLKYTSEPTRRDPRAWYTEQVAYAERMFLHAEEDHRRSVATAGEINVLLDDLRATLPVDPPHPYR
jgi:hypothetical protein